MPKQQTRKQVKTNQQIIYSSIESFKKLNREELDSIRWHINALLGDDYLNDIIEKKFKG